MISAIQKNTEFAKAGEKISGGSGAKEISAVEFSASDEIEKIGKMRFHGTGIGSGTERGKIFGGRERGDDGAFERIGNEEGQKQGTLEVPNLFSRDTSLADVFEEFTEPDAERVAEVTEAIFEDHHQNGKIQDQHERNAVGKTVAVSISKHIKPGKKEHDYDLRLLDRAFSRRGNHRFHSVFTIHRDTNHCKGEKVR